VGSSLTALPKPSIVLALDSYVRIIGCSCSAFKRRPVIPRLSATLASDGHSATYWMV